jgi:hypothetical protein
LVEAGLLEGYMNLFIGLPIKRCHIGAEETHKE